MKDWILHVDMDQFIAAVEIRRRPELTGLPVVVGGDGDPTRPRQVAATATYEARAFGVRSGMPLRAALRRCPDCVFLAVDREAYDQASAEVMAVLRSFPVTVEVWGWDEAYIATRVEDPVVLAQQLKAAVFEATKLTCAVGVGDSKQQAKIAAQSAKPGGVGVLTDETWLEVMSTKPVGALFGVGNRTAARLADVGIETVGQLATTDHAALAGVFGPKTGPWLVLQARGGPDRTVRDTPYIAKSVSREHTYTTDLTDPVQIINALNALSVQVAVDVQADGRAAVRIGVKVRTATFWTRTKAMKIDATSDPAQIAAAARTVLERFEIDRPVRLLGVRAEFAADD